MKILVLDNYDSFTYNLVHYVKELTDAEVDVIRNDKIDIEDVEKYDKIILSPGPGVPKEAGMLIEIIKAYGRTKPILGICLGMQAIAEAFGGEIYNLDTVFHGVASEVNILDSENLIFKGLPKKIVVGRYHSWVVKKDSLPSCFKITCEDENGLLMAFSHKEFKVHGIQFHPESIITEKGKDMIKNWLEEKI